MNFEKRLKALEVAKRPAQATQTIEIEITFSAFTDESGEPIPDGPPIIKTVQVPLAGRIDTTPC